MKVKFSFIVCLFILFVTACSPSEKMIQEAIEKTQASEAEDESRVQTAIVQTENAKPTSTSTQEMSPTPSNTPTNEFTVTPISTDTPEGMIFRDDFDNELQPGWKWEKEIPDRWELTDEGWLKIIGQDGSLLHNASQSNLLWRDTPGGNYEVSIHLDAPTSSNYQQATLFLYTDGDNYVAINRGFCSSCVTGGNGIFMEYKIAGSWGAYQFPINRSDVYLKLVNQDNVIIGYYAIKEGEWQKAGSVGGFKHFDKVGLGVTNSDSANINDDLTASFDYIEIREP